MNDSILKCPACGECYPDSHAMEVHIATVHVFYSAYECEICQNALFPTDQSLREHYEKIHKKNAFKVKYKVSPELDQRKEMVEKLLAQAVSASKEMEFYNPYTSQLLQSCTAQLLLQERIMQSAELINTTSTSADNNATKMESNNSLLEINLGNNMADCSNDRTHKINFFGPSNCKIKKMDLEEMEHIVDEDEKPILDNSLIASNSPKKRGRRRKDEKEGSEEVKSSTMKNDGDVECCECKRKVGKYRNSMLIHTSTHHCNQPIFECLSENCNKKWYSLSARTKEHIESKHGGDQALLKDNRNNLLPILKERTAQLFPDHYSHYTFVDHPSAPKLEMD